MAQLIEILWAHRTTFRIAGHEPKVAGDFVLAVSNLCYNKFVNILKFTMYNINLDCVLWADISYLVANFMVFGTTFKAEMAILKYIVHDCW